MSEAIEILVVEDDDAIATGLALNLKLAGYRPMVASDGDEGLELARSRSPGLILLDLNLPRRSGLELLSALRKEGDSTPVIVISARVDEFDKVGALRLGADDYVTKPFALAELLARVDAVLRRAAVQRPASAPSTSTSDGLVSFGECLVDLERRLVRRDEAEVSITHLEFELLAYFLRHPNRVVSRDRLLRDVWGQTTGSPRTVDNFVGQLRAKLESDPEKPVHLVTVRGSGYRFDLAKK